MKEGGWSLFGAGLVVPWCCLAPAALSLAGVTGLSLGLLTRIEALGPPISAAGALMPQPFI